MNCYKVTEVAKMLKVTTRTIYNMLLSGELKSFRVGKAVRIPQSEIDRIAKTD